MMLSASGVVSRICFCDTKVKVVLKVVSNLRSGPDLQEKVGNKLPWQQ